MVRKQTFPMYRSGSNPNNFNQTVHSSNLFLMGKDISLPQWGRLAMSIQYQLWREKSICSEHWVDQCIDFFAHFLSLPLQIHLIISYLQLSKSSAPDPFTSPTHSATVLLRSLPSTALRVLLRSAAHHLHLSPPLTRSDSYLKFGLN